MSTSQVFNTLTSGILTKSRSGVAQILQYRRSKKHQLSTQSRNAKINPNKWKSWRALKRALQNVWFQLGGNGGSHLNTRIVREIWRLHVGSSDDYFIKVIHNACKRNTDLANQFLNGPHSKYVSKDALIAKLAENMYGFFDTVMSDEIRSNPDQIKELAYQLGRRHAHFSSEQYTLTFWDTLNLACMEELENTGLFDEIDLKSWQRLLAQVFDYMFLGYTEARELIQMSKVETTMNNNNGIL
ncbi:hypothetical protein M3Y97_00493500 [Aphelenchoides bicaudatus]|nr:hypothetical protein M3Y97_00493500 [Aphelenchoides bicaudatus]